MIFCHDKGGAIYLLNTSDMCGSTLTGVPAQDMTCTGALQVRSSPSFAALLNTADMCVGPLTGVPAQDMTRISVLQLLCPKN